jgi:FAD/FMN-containing dehydrogenase
VRPTPDAPRLRRRSFLLGGAAALVAACTKSDVTPSPSQTAAASPAPTATVTAIASPTPRPAPDFAALARSLTGDLIRPGDQRYDGARLLYNTRFDDIRPQAVARCVSADDVKTCVRFARTTGVPLAVRGGGHSYAGWSTGTGLVIDLSQLRTITIGEGQMTAGGGAQLIDVYDAVARRGQGIAGGSCPTVGLVGLALGGGLGVLTRQWGLTCDDMISAQVVTADGEVRTCDERNEPDLFWALRGGGGGSLGVVTSLTMRTHPAQDLALGFMTWPASRASAVISAWSAWMAAAPASLWSTMHLDVGSGGPLTAIHSVSTGTTRDMNTAQDELVALIGSAPEYREAGARPYRDVMLLEAGCLTRTVAQCHLGDTTADGLLQRETYAAKSIVADRARLAGERPFTDAAVAALVDVMRGAPGGAILIDSLGGAVSRVPIDATAFPHRNAFAVLQLIASWQTDGTDAIAWLRKAHATLRPLIGNGAYVNYIDPDLANWQDAYWGPNYARLVQVKKRYDPDRVFDFPQAVGR